MKRHLKLVIFLLIAVLACAGALPLTQAGSSSAVNPNQDDSIFSKGASPVLTQARQDIRQDIDKILKRFDSLDLDPRALAEQVRRTGAMRLPTSERIFDLELTAHDMRSPNYRAEAVFDGGEVRSIERSPVRTYKGSVRGMGKAQARFTIDENTVEGLIITPSELYFVESARKFSASASDRDFLVYKGSDVIKTSLGECGVTLADKVENEAARVKADTALAIKPVTDEVFSPPRTVDIATEADFEYFTALGTVDAAIQEIVATMNQVEGIYNTQFGIQFTVVFQNVFATANDPYTATESTELLTEFAEHWTSNRGSIARDLAHMWTGKNLNENTIGIAFRPGLDCPDSPLGFGLSQRLALSSQRGLLAAHEIGHNFNASHTDEENPVPPNCTDTIMESSLSAGTQATFCAFSVNQIDTHATANQACLAQALTPGCTYTLSATSQSFPNTGGSGNVTVTTSGTNCAWAAGSTVPWVTITSPVNNTNTGVVNFTVASNTSGYARSGVLRIAEQDFTVRQDGGAGCAITPISFGQTINASLANTDCRSSQRPQSFADQYSFSGEAGRQIRIEMSAVGVPTVDTYLYLIGPVNGPLGPVATENDDIVLGEQTNSRIPVNGFFTLPATGAYLIESTSFDDNETGNYSITLSDNSSSNSVSFSSGSFSVNEGVDGNGRGFEGTGLRTITVTRSGADVSGSARVDFATSEGTADERRDYTKTRGTLRFGPNETSKSFTVFITDDVFKPGDMARSRNDFNQFIVIESQTETVNLTLSNPAGTTLGATPTAVLTINDNDSVTGANPVRNETLNARFFVRQQYHDFLSREPDLGGLNFWSNGITVCGGDLNCRKLKSIDTSAAFFLSIEFRDTGYLVHRAYKAAFGDINPPSVPAPVRLNDFLADARRIGEGVQVGIGPWEITLENNKVAYFEEFVIRPQFLSVYPLTMTPQTFVDTLNTRSGGVLSTAERNTLVGQLQSGIKSRGAAVRAVAEDATMFNGELNRSFVLMQYFGYLRRNPNDPQDTNFNGFTFWLNKLNQFNGDFRAAEMVKAFIESIEYVERFGP